MAAMLASCSESFEAQQPVAPSQMPAVAGETPVSFGIYTSRAGDATRGGATGTLTTDGLKDANGAIGQAGFGVFAYYTDNLYYTGSTKPNFMYNQQVTYKGGLGAWTYEPVKYWPNEYDSNADADKVSFFAYAPYLGCDPATGSVDESTWGISGFSKNSASGDPIVKYATSFDLTKQVDLCWAVKNGGTWNTLTDQGSQTIADGYAWKDVEHPATIEQKMTFYFRHATAQLNVQIDTDADIIQHQDGSAINGDTKVYVRSITFKGITQRGALNLNNTVANQPLWLNFNGQGELQPASSPVVINDGRLDGREGRTADAYETNPALNPNIIQTAEVTTGVTGTLQNLFSVESLSGTDDEKAAAPIYVIPTGDDALTVTIAYDVETADPNLGRYLSDGTTHGYSVQNVITKEITFGSNSEGLKAGNNYQVKFHLGLNGVKFDANVEDWYDAAGGVAKLPADVMTERITLDEDSLDLSVGDEIYLIPTIKPDNATDMTVTWTSSDETVATVDANGKVTAVGAGTATITATTSGGQTATCEVTVSAVACSGSSLSEAAVGMIICEHGKVHTATTEDLACGGKKVAVVAYVGDAGTADYSEGSEGYHGLAIALYDATGSEGCIWYTEEAGAPCVDIQYNPSTIYNTPDVYGKGIYNTNKLAGGCEADHVHDAATAAKNYKYDTDVSEGAHPASTSQWFLPTLYQWNLIVKTMCEYDADLANIARVQLQSAAFNTKIIAAGGYGVTASDYWSSTQAADSYAYCVRFGAGTWRKNKVTGNSMSYTLVRSVLAF